MLVFTVLFRAGHRVWIYPSPNISESIVYGIGAVTVSHPLYNPLEFFLEWV